MKEGGRQPPKPVKQPSVTTKLWLAGAAAATLTVWLSKRHLTLPLAFEDSYTLCSKKSNIYTVDGSLLKAECISVTGGYISDVGSQSEITARAFGSWTFGMTELIEYFTGPLITPIYIPDNSIIVPGLADAHAHIIEAGFKMQLPLESAKSVNEIVTLVRNYILRHPDIHSDTTRWIEGMGWDQTKWPGKTFPTAADLDADPVLKGRPIWLSRVDGHASWVSSAVLDKMKDIPKEVDGGKIMRDKKGKPTGVFLDNAMDLIPRPAWTEDQMTDYFKSATKAALSYGLTSIQDADAQHGYINIFKKFADQGQLPLRIYAMAYSNSSSYWGSEFTRVTGYGSQRRFNLRSIKLFTDGALGSWGAAMLAPYSDAPETKGILRIEEGKLKELVGKFYEDGWQVNIHCIGDRANRVVLDVYEEVLSRPNANVSEWRPRIEHAQIFAPDDLDRVGKLGVITSVQPTHATSDMWYAESRLGKERMKGAYAYQTLLQASPNSVLPLGSDFPVEGINPLLGFYAAVTRLSPDGKSPHGSGGWYSDERLTRAQALKGMTLDPAYASFAENELGSLRPGRRADLVVLDRDIMSVPAQDILETKVQATVIDGEVVYGSLDL